MERDNCINQFQPTRKQRVVTYSSGMAPFHARGVRFWERDPHEIWWNFRNSDSDEEKMKASFTEIHWLGSFFTQTIAVMSLMKTPFVVE